MPHPSYVEMLFFHTLRKCYDLARAASAHCFFRPRALFFGKRIHLVRPPHLGVCCLARAGHCWTCLPRVGSLGIAPTAIHAEEKVQAFFM